MALPSPTYLEREIHDQLPVSDPPPSWLTRVLGLPDLSQPVSRCIIIVGQSNAAGPTPVSTYPAEYRVTDPNVFAPTSTGSAWNVWEPGVTNRNGANAGFDLSLVTELRKLYPNDKLYILNVAYGSTNLHTDWNAKRTGFYLQTGYLWMSAALRNLPMNSVVSAICWNQGEADNDGGANATAYQANLLALIADMRRFLGLPYVPFIASRLPDAGGVRNAVQNIKSQNLTLNFDWVDQDGFPRVDGNSHFQAPGMVEIGKRYAQRIALFNYVGQVRRQWPLVNQAVHAHVTSSLQPIVPPPSKVCRIVYVGTIVRVAGGGTYLFDSDLYRTDNVGVSLGSASNITLPDTAETHRLQYDVDPHNTNYWVRDHHKYIRVRLVRQSGSGTFDGRIYVTFEDYLA